MKCADPVLCYIDGNGLKRYRNFSLASKITRSRKHSMVFNCGKCIFCRKKRAFELACKCVLHASLYSQNCFLTLTYDESKPGYHNNFDYRDIQLFKKVLRSHVSRHHGGKKIQIFNVHEYGKKGKKHWHLIVFNHDFEDKEIHSIRNQIPLYKSELLTKLWPHGHNSVGDVSAASAMYQAQYIEKDFKNGNVTNSRKSHSKHSGIGRPYFDRHYKQLLTLGYVPVNGQKLPLPRSFERRAHKHYCHFHERSAFFDTPDRKALYRPFKIGEENKEIAELYVQFKATKQEKIKDLERQWDEVISLHLTTGEDPDFINSASNTIYDLRNRTKPERF